MILKIVKQGIYRVFFKRQACGTSFFLDTIATKKRNGVPIGLNV